MTRQRYYNHEGVPCRVTFEDDDSRIRAEGYFPGKGFQPVAVTPVLWRGEILTEREFKALVARKIQAERTTES